MLERRSIAHPRSNSLGRMLFFLFALPLLSAAASTDSLIWGPYKPNLYFGVRSRFPNSLTTGLIWARVEDFSAAQSSFRWTCEQGDNMAGYGWDEYDSRTGGTQTIHDVDNKIDITTEFVKIPGGSHGGNWAARIRGVPREGAPSDLRTTVAFGINMEGVGSVQLENESDPVGYEGSVSFQGETEHVGRFRLEVTDGPSTNVHPFLEHPSYQQKPLDRTFVSSMALNPEQTWQTKPVLFQMLKTQIEAYIAEYGEQNLPPPFQTYTITNGGDGQRANVHMVQKVFEGAFEFDVLYSSASSSQTLTSDDLTKAINANAASFSDRYQSIFKRTAPFTDAKYDRFSKSLFSNLLGGAGYFYGMSIVDSSRDPAYDEENEGFWTEVMEAKKRNMPQLQGPYELFTLIPSRPFFPRGFLWDEGFHLISILNWDLELALEIITSWSRLMDEDGWIAREQILGDEARIKVPEEFRCQSPHIANPPTLFLAIERFIDKLESSSVTKAEKASFTSALKEIYPLLQRHYDWYRRTQKGDVKTYERTAFSSKEAYRWRGRTPAHILASGLDDYPRAQPPHPGELHVDLMSWMGMMSRSLERIATAIGEKDDAKELAGHLNAITRNLDDLHWSEEEQAYCDVTIDDYEEDIKVCHKGYVSLFPFMTGLVGPDSPRLGAILDLIADKSQLWSPYGIRSLSLSDPLYSTEENYWRSPIWMNMNYLILNSLLNVAQSKSSHKDRAARIYTGLRKNLIDTVFASWEATGFAWEQYNPETGAGQRTQHFTGWTSLVVEMLSMPDLKTTPEHKEL